MGLSLSCTARMFPEPVLGSSSTWSAPSFILIFEVQTHRPRFLLPPLPPYQRFRLISHAQQDSNVLDSHVVSFGSETRLKRVRVTKALSEKRYLWEKCPTILGKPLLPDSSSWWPPPKPVSQALSSVSIKTFKGFPFPQINAHPMQALDGPSYLRHPLLPS